MGPANMRGRRHIREQQLPQPTRPGVFHSLCSVRFVLVVPSSYLVQVVCPAAQGGGLEILGAFVLRGGALFLDVDVSFTFQT